MLCLVIGGSGSGKSEYAEKRCMELFFARENGKRILSDAIILGNHDQERKPLRVEPGMIENRDKLIYIATMKSPDAESDARILRHRQMRAGKGFETLECQTHLEEAKIPVGATVLLECVSNLVANEMFSPEGNGRQMVSGHVKSDGEETDSAVGGTIFENAVTELVLRGVRRLYERAGHTVIVTNQVFSDGISYDKETERYQRILAKINAEIATLADEVVEVVHGIPLCLKGCV